MNKMTDAVFSPLSDYVHYSAEEMKHRSSSLYAEMKRRRTVRHFSDQPVSREVIEDCLRTAATAPSGANMQPWHFVVVTDQDIKRQIREAAEQSEREFYQKQSERTWGKALKHLGTNEQKPFLETASYLIVIFAQRYGISPDGHKVKHYYVRDSVGIATGILIAAIHNAGLVSLPYTPSRMGFLNRVLERPDNERASVVLVVGYPEEGTMVPELSKKTLDETTTFM